MNSTPNTETEIETEAEAEAPEDQSPPDFSPPDEAPKEQPPADYVPPDYTKLEGIPSLRALFMPPASLSENRIVRAVGSSGLRRAADYLGVEYTRNNWRTNIENLYVFFRNTQEVDTPECDCTPESMPEGLRFWEADNDLPVTVFIVPEAYTKNQVQLIYTALAVVQAVTQNLKFEVLDQSVEPTDNVNIVLDSGEIDGRGRTLGFTRYWQVSAEDEYLNNETNIDVYIRMDSAEAFNIDRYFLTVMIHEIGHACGLRHIDEAVDNVKAIDEIMSAVIRRFHTEATPHFIVELVARYLVRQPVSA